jgi:hypothetical protein
MTQSFPQLQLLLMPIAVFGLLSNAFFASPTAISLAQSEKPQSAGSPNAKPLFNLKFSKDYFPGTRDAKGQFMGGTETGSLVAHQGRLWAGIGYWKDTPGRDPAPGPQVLVKTAANQPWQVDRSWGSDYDSIESMASVTFTTDAKGKPLQKPETLLLVGPDRKPGAKITDVWSRNNVTGSWTKMVISTDPESVNYKPGVRVLRIHTDRVTGVQSIFAGLAKGAIYRGVYDPNSSGRIRWDTQPEAHPAQNRVMSMAVANGVLYAAITRDRSTPKGGLYKRIDGAKPRWELVYQWPLSDEPNKGNLRGLTAFSPSQGGPEFLLGAQEKPGLVHRIDPMKQYQVSQDFDFRQFFIKQWGGLGGAASLAAYNDMTPVVHPTTKERALLMGLWMNHPQQNTELGLSSWYLVRRTSGAYEYGRVFDPNHPKPDAPKGLRATRTIIVSPFTADRGRVLYFGGYDAGGDDIKHNTAWIYKAEIQ